MRVFTGFRENPINLPHHRSATAKTTQIAALRYGFPTKFPEIYNLLAPEELEQMARHAERF